MTFKCKVRYPKLPKSGIKGFSEEDNKNISIMKQKQDLEKKFGMKLITDEDRKILSEISGKQKRLDDNFNRPVKDLTDQLIKKFSKVIITQNPDGTLTLSRPDGFAKYRTEIERQMSGESLANSSFLPDDTILCTGHRLGFEAQRIIGICANLTCGTCTNQTTKEKTDCIIISGDEDVTFVESIIGDLGLEIMPMDSEDEKRTMRGKDVNGESFEDIDEILEPLQEGEKKRLKSRSIINKFKENRITV